MENEKLFLFKTTAGITLLATPSMFKRYWYDSIIDSGHAFTSEPAPEEATNG